MTKTIIASFAALISLTAAGVASAQTAVPYGDLDLSSQAGIAQFENRVALAAGQECASEAGGRPGLTGSVSCERAFHESAMRALPIAAREQVIASRSETVLVAAR